MNVRWIGQGLQVPEASAAERLLSKCYMTFLNYLKVCLKKTLKAQSSQWFNRGLNTINILIIE